MKNIEFSYLLTETASTPAKSWCFGTAPGSPGSSGPSRCWPPPGATCSTPINRPAKSQRRKKHAAGRLRCRLRRVWRRQGLIRGARTPTPAGPGGTSGHAARN
jgi:hypothetical protein